MTSTIPIANLYYLLCYAWRHVREADPVRLEELAGLDGTHHLLGKVLAEGTFRLIRQGIDRGYREIREDLAASVESCRSARRRNARYALVAGQPASSRSFPTTCFTTASCVPPSTPC